MNFELTKILLLFAFITCFIGCTKEGLDPIEIPLEVSFEASGKVDGQAFSFGSTTVMATSSNSDINGAIYEGKLFGNCVDENVISTCSQSLEIKVSDTSTVTYGSDGVPEIFHTGDLIPRHLIQTGGQPQVCIRPAGDSVLVEGFGFLDGNSPPVCLDPVKQYPDLDKLYVEGVIEGAPGGGSFTTFTSYDIIYGIRNGKPTFYHLNMDCEILGDTSVSIIVSVEGNETFPFTDYIFQLNNGSIIELNQPIIFPLYSFPGIQLFVNGVNIYTGESFNLQYFLFMQNPFLDFIDCQLPAVVNIQNSNGSLQEVGNVDVIYTDSDGVVYTSGSDVTSSATLQVLSFEKYRLDGSGNETVRTDLLFIGDLKNDQTGEIISFENLTLHFAFGYN